MPKALLIVVVVLALGAGGVVAYAAVTQPDSFRVSRSATIDAPPEKLIGILTDLRRGAEWSPF